MTTWLESSFPNLQSSTYSVESKQTAEYNCIAWAAGENHRWWGPARSPFAYWPSELPPIATLDNFVRAFQTLGYEPTNSEGLESEYEKVAIYIDDNGVPTHMSRQRSSGIWTSKLGEAEDIDHETPYALEGAIYGRVAQILKRPLP